MFVIGNTYIDIANNQVDIFGKYYVDKKNIVNIDQIDSKLNEIEKILEKEGSRYRRRLLITEGVFSMEGSLAPLDH